MGEVARGGAAAGRVSDAAGIALSGDAVAGNTVVRSTPAAHGSGATAGAGVEAGRVPIAPAVTESGDIVVGRAPGAPNAVAGGIAAHHTSAADLRLAAIDIGTVSTRLLCATVRDGAITQEFKRTIITDLGAGVDATGRFAPDAVARVLDACARFCADIAAHGAQHVSTTLTSAARDAKNGDLLLNGLCELGLKPQVIPGEVEARLTFYGVARDFPGERIAVADLGGGSTELTVGALTAHLGKLPADTLASRPDRPSPGAPTPRPVERLALERVASLDIGCRRVTERFFASLPPRVDELAAAAAWARDLYVPYWQELGSRPDRLVAVGGTVTTLVALVHELAVYDSTFVHLRDLTLSQVEACIDLMRGLDAAGIAALPGVQAKRAGVLLAGAVALRELMRAGGYDRLTVSENSLLVGAVATMADALVSGTTAIGWVPELSAHV